MKDEAPPARLLIVDDHGLVREGTRAMLGNQPDLEVVGEAENGREAIELCRKLRPDLVLMDVRMPEMDGIAATREIKREQPRTSVLMLTTHESPEYLLDAVKAGAAGYVLKDATRRQLLNAVRRVLEGESPLDQELAMRLIQNLAGGEADRHARPVSEPSGSHRQEPLPEPPLTTRELEVLRLLARGRTNREITEELRVSLSSAKTYVRRIMDKLGVSDRTQAAVRAAELGLLPELEE